MFSYIRILIYIKSKAIEKKNLNDITINTFYSIPRHGYELNKKNWEIINTVFYLLSILTVYLSMYIVPW